MEPATIVLGDLFMVLLSNHNQLQPSVTSLLFLRWPWWVFYKASDRIPWRAAWTLLLLSWEGDCWVFPAVSCCRSWTQLLQHTESTPEIKVFFPAIWNYPEPWATLPLSLHVHSTQPGLCTCGAVHHHERTTAVSSSSHEGKDGFFFSVGSGKSSAGNWQCDQNHVKSLCWSTALKAHNLGQVTED